MTETALPTTQVRLEISEDFTHSPESSHLDEFEGVTNSNTDQAGNEQVPLESNKSSAINIPRQNTKIGELRRLLDKGIFTTPQILDTLYPGVPLAIAKNRLITPMSKVKSQLKQEGAFIRKVGEPNQKILKIAHHSNNPINVSRALKEMEAVFNGERAILANTTNPLDITSNSNPLLIDPYEAQNEIPNPIEKRNGKSTKPRLTLTRNYELPGYQLALIGIPGKGKTKEISLTNNEAHLLQTIFNTASIFTLEQLEIKLVDIARSEEFERIGGFEHVYNALNKKLPGWGFVLTLNENKEVILGSAKTTPRTSIIPQIRDGENDNPERFEGRVRRRKPSHGKLRL